MKPALRTGLAAILAAAMLVIVLNGCGRKETAPPSSANPLNETRLVAAEGKIEIMPGGEVDVGSELIGRIIRLAAREGDQVSRGQILAELDDSDAKARLHEAEAALSVARARLREAEAGARPEEIAQAVAVTERARAEEETARRELDRIRSLYDSGLTTTSALDTQDLAHRAATARLHEAEEALALLRSGTRKETLALLAESVRQAESGVALARSLFEKTSIRSPISGIVLRNDLEEGEVIIPEITLCRIGDLERMRVTAEVDETDIGRVVLGARAEITSDAWPGRVFSGKVSEMANYVGPRKVRPNNPALNLDVKVIQVRILMDEPGQFKPGMTVEVRIHPE